MAVTENMLIDISINSDNASKDLQTLTQNVDDLSISNTKNKLTLKSLEAELQNLSKIFKFVSIELNKASMSMGSVLSTYDSQLRVVNDDMKKYSSSVATATKSTLIANQVVSDSSGFFSTLSKTLTITTGSFQSLVFQLSSFVTMFEFIVNSKNIKLLSDIVAILAALAVSKGMFGLGDQLRNISGRLADFSVNMESFKERSSKNFTELSEKAKTFNANMDLLGNIKIGGELALFGAAASKILYKISPQFKNFVNEVGAGFGELGVKVKSFSGIIGKSLTGWGIVEAAGLMGPLLIMLGNQLKESESSITRLIGTTIKWVGILAAGATAVLTAITAAVGSFSVSLGEKLANSMAASTEKFIKFQTVMSQFTFTLEGFSKVYGETSVGALSYWKTVMEDLYKTTAFSREEIAKSVKLMVAEGQVIGLTVEDNTKLLKTAADVAASTGRDLYDVSQMIVSGITNNADAVLSLGIDIRNASVAHTDYAKNAGIALEQMDNQQLAMARLNTLYEKTVPIIGAAANQITTIAGANAVYEKTLQDIQIKLGQTGTATQAYYVMLTKIARFFADLPPFVLNLIGNLKDLAAVFLIVFGRVLQISVLAFTVITAFKLLNYVLGVTIGLSISLSGIMAFLFKRIFPLIAIYYSLKTALEQLSIESAAFAKFTDEIASAFSSTSDSAKKASSDVSFLSKTVQAVIDVIKLSIIGLVQTIRILQLAWLNIKKLFTTNDSEQLQYYDWSIQQVETSLADLSKTSNKVKDNLTKLTGTTAIAAESSNNLAQSTKENVKFAEKFVSKVKELAAKINSGWDPAIERQKILGNEFDKTIAEYKQAQAELTNIFKLKSSAQELAQKYAEAEKKALSASLEIDKLRVDAFKKLKEQRQDISIEILKTQGKNIQAINIERAAAVNAIDDQIRGLLRLGFLKQTEINQLNETRKLILKSSDLKIIDERNKFTQKQIEAEKLLSDIRKESAKVEEDAIAEIKARVAARLDEITKMELSLKASNDYGVRAKAALDAARTAAANIFPAGLAKLQKDEIDKVLQANIELQKTITENGMTQYEQTQETYKVQNKALEKEYQRLQMSGLLYDAQGNINEKLWEQLSIQEELIKTQRDAALARQPSKEFQKLEQIGTNAATTIGNTFKTGALSMVGGSMSIVSAIVSAISALLDFIPQFFQAIADVLNKIADFPQTLANAIMNLNKGLLRLFTDLVPNIAKFVPKLIDDTLENAANRIPDALEKMMDQLPEYASKIIDRIPDWIEKLIQSLINNAPRLVMQTAKLWMVVLPKIYWSVFTMIIRELPQAIINGIKKGLKDLTNLNQFFGFKMPSAQEIGDQLSLAWKASTKTLTGEASKLFAVMDLNQAAGAQDMATKISKAIENGHISGSRWWAEKWNAALAKLKELWSWLMKQATAIWDDIVTKWRQLWDGIVALLNAVWNTLNQIWTTIIAALTALWNSLQTIWTAVINALTALWTSLQTIWDKVLNTLSVLWNSLQSIWTAITSSLTNFTSSISDVFGKATSSLMSVGEFFSKMLESFTTALKSVVEAMTSLLSFLKDVGTSIISSLKRGLDGLVDMFSSFGSNISNSFTTGISSIGTKFSEFGSKIFSSFTSGLDSLGEKFGGFGSQIFNSLKSGLDGLGKFFTDMLNNLNPGSLLEKIFKIDMKGQGKVETTLGIDVPGLNFARGGVVPGTPVMAGDSKLNDRIVALLSPGEAIIPRSLMQNEMIKSLVGSILAGKFAPPAYWGGGVSISAKGGISIGGTQIPGTALPTIPTSVEQAKAEIIQQVVAPIAPVVDLWQQVRDQVMKMVWSLFENAKFHEGGLVPAFAMGGEIPALLTPGEYVLNPSAVRNIGLSNLTAMNAGKQSAGVTNQTINVNIEITPTQLDDNYVRTKLMPRMKDEIRRASLDGSFVVSGKGIRR